MTLPDPPMRRGLGEMFEDSLGAVSFLSIGTYFALCQWVWGYPAEGDPPALVGLFRFFIRALGALVATGVLVFTICALICTFRGAARDGD